MYIYMNALRGMGVVMIPMAGGFLELGAKVAAAFALSSLFSYSGIWFAWPIGWLLSSALLVPYFYMGRWKKKINWIAKQTDDAEQQTAASEA
jgi:Na+-driven multidrug efflux pump